MSQVQCCPQCGAELPLDAPDRVCPRCVLGLALTTQPRAVSEHTLRIKCPHCGNGIQIVQPAGGEVTCANCGSSFHVEPGATTTYQSTELPETIGKFHVLQLLGRGAFGSVYKARDPELDRVVAIKVPRAGYFRTHEEEERFLREARSAARLSHPGIVPVHEIAHAEGVPYLVSDYVESLTLADLLTGVRPDFQETAELVARLAEALDHAHRAGIVHRDIKPSNILIDGARAPHLTDFGLARRDEGEITVTIEGQILGTPAYMAPEQAAGEAVDGRGDVYSLGVVLYEMLTGELPFHGNQRMLLYQVVHDEPRPPRRLNDRIPRDLETICLKAIAKQPARRYATAGALADDLRRYLKREPIKARPTGRAERLWRWCRRNPIVATLSASLLIVLIAGLVGVTLLWLQAEVAGIAAGKATEQARKHLATARWNLYVSRIQLARQELQEGHVPRAQQLLDSLRPTADETDLRGFEWHYLACLCRLSLPVLQHGEQVGAITYSPDGRMLAAIHGQAVSAWDPVTGMKRWELTDPGMKPFSVSFSRDGRRLACAGYDFKVHFWDMQTGQPILPAWVRPTQPKAIAFSPTQDQMAIGEMDGLTLHDTATGKEVARLPMPKDRVHWVSYSRDGRRLAGLRNGEVLVWDLAARKVLRAFKATTLTGGALSPDGRFVAQAGPNTQITVHDLAAGKSSVLGAPSADDASLSCLVWSQDGSRLAAAAPGEVIRIWDVATRKEQPALRGHVEGVRWLAFSPDGLRLASASTDGTVRIWRVSDERSMSTGAPRVESPDGRRYYTYAAGRATAWDASSHKEVMSFEGVTGKLDGLCCSPDGAVLAGIERIEGNEPGKPLGGARWQVVLWDTNAGRRLHTLPASLYSNLAFSPDGRSLAISQYEEKREKQVIERGQKSTVFGTVVTSFKATVQVWEVATGRQQVAWDCPFGHVKRLALTPDGRHVLGTAVMPTGEKDASAALWEAAVGKTVWRLHMTSLPGGRAPAEALSPDGRRIAVGTHGALLVLDTATGEEQLRLVTPWLPYPAFSADGSRVIAQQLVPRGDQHEVRIWDAATGEELLTVSGIGPQFQLSQYGRDGRWSRQRYPRDTADWDVAARSAEVWRYRDAELLVRLAFARSPWRDNVLDELRRVPVFDEAVRQEALAQAQRRPMDSKNLNEAAWDIVAKPGAAAADLRRAQAMAEEAVRQRPKEGFYLNTLGVAHYRRGNYDQALQTLQRSEKLNAARLKSAHPADLAFLAMSAHKVGQAKEAQEYLDRLRTTMKLPAWTQNEEAVRFLREAEALLKQK
jgi:WD40 repeat protein/tRNA A-37 threonylcarbamoyl transferase component Bud32/ribosomal protein S27E